MTKQSDINPIGVRMDDELKQALKKSAEAKKLSLNTEITNRLKASLKADEIAEGAESGDPYQAILAATQTIHVSEKVINNAVMLIAKDKGNVKVKEEKSLLDQFGKEMIDAMKAISEMPADMKDNLIALVNEFSKNKLKK